MIDVSISVVIPTHNRAKLVPRAVASALAALEPTDEIVVVDDGSTDGTEQALAPFRKMIRYLRTPNGGAARARNIGIRESRNPLVAFLDSDDEWMADKIQLQRTLMRSHPDVMFCFSNFAVRMESGDEYHNYLINWHQDSRSWNEILGMGIPFSSIASLPVGRTDFQIHIGDLFPSLMSSLYVFTSTVLVRREAAGSALRFAEDLSVYEDWECYGRLAQAGLAAYLECETTWNYGHQGPRLSNADSLERATAYIKVLERVWGSDHVFLAKHGNRYREKMSEHHLLLAKEHLHRGDIQRARQELRLSANAPFPYWALASLPGNLVRTFLRMRQAFYARLAGQD